MEELETDKFVDKIETTASIWMLIGAILIMLSPFISILMFGDNGKSYLLQTATIPIFSIGLFIIIIMLSFLPILTNYQKSPAIFEIGNIIHVRRKFLSYRSLTPEEIINSYEYKMFKKNHPKLCELAEKENEK